MNSVLNGVDGLVNNAAVAVLAKFTEVPPDQFDHLMNVNVKAMMHVGQLVSKQMIKNQIKVQFSMIFL